MGPVKKIILCILIFSACIEPYKFNIQSEGPTLVVEGYISNVSYNESLKYPSDGNFFTIELRQTGDVTNKNDKVVENASVSLESDLGGEWDYVESPSKPGTYILPDKGFKAIPGQSYRLHISLAEGKVYESEWETLPEIVNSPIGPVDFEEVEKRDYVVRAGEEALGTVKGLNVRITVPERESGKIAFYRWDFIPLWVFIAPITSSTSPIHKCWATNENYLPGYVLQADVSGGYSKNLFFIKTAGNERIFERFSVLIRQHQMSENFFSFWKEMQEQVESGGLSDIPPYNLQSNINAVNSEEKVSGYFSVVGEKAARWYFNKEQLSYFIDDRLEEECEEGFHPRLGYAPHCINCLDYHNGTATNIEPFWWE